MSYLLDTNVLSELTRRKPDARVVAWFGRTEEASLHLSVLSLGEIRKGVERLLNDAADLLPAKGVDGGFPPVRYLRRGRPAAVLRVRAQADLFPSHPVLQRIDPVPARVDGDAVEPRGET